MSEDFSEFTHYPIKDSVKNTPLSRDIVVDYDVTRRDALAKIDNAEFKFIHLRICIIADIKKGYAEVQDLLHYGTYKRNKQFEKHYLVEPHKATLKDFRGYGISAASGKLGAVVAQLFLLFLKDIGGKNHFISYLFQIFAAFAFAGFLCSYLIPETKGRSLEETSNENLLHKHIKFEEIS
ncbi:2190_t:CDS:2 [Racocetra fulgida]|uniref:2190_t:CDS:1 n=1 Tax=Racocetra fulgida TaxID=60492 RepID=A0A9N8W6P2_9GLOM|nr:2190_t:CDS:2 [Racocetra fulgida]